MAIYHCSVKIISRNAGRSAVAAAAYRAGEDIINEYDGTEHDYTRKKWIEFTEIILPENAPSEYADRSVLWNAVEMSEKAKDAQLCREFELALPVEMTREQQVKIVEQFAQEKLVSQGMCVDIAIHAPPVTNDRHQPIDTHGNVTHNVTEMQFINPHAHVLATVRPLDENGHWEKKSEIEYLCKRGDKGKGFTAEEFKTAKAEGWEKQYKFSDGKKKLWLTASQGQELGLERINRSPKTSQFGRRNENVAYWNSKERVFEWRECWEKIVNAEFARMQSDIRIDSRSFKGQGRTDEFPTIHMGPSAVNMERRAARELCEGKTESQVLHSDVGNINKQIREHNRFLREIKARIDAAIKEAHEIAAAIASRLEGIRAKIIGIKYQEETLSLKEKILLSRIQLERDRLAKYGMATHSVGKANRAAAEEIRQLQDRSTVVPTSSEVQTPQQNRLQELQEQIEAREEYLISVGRMCGFTSLEAYRNAKKGYMEERRDYDTLQKAIGETQHAIARLKTAYMAELEAIPEECAAAMDNSRSSARPKLEKIVMSRLRKEYGDEFDRDRYAQSCSSADNLLGIAPKKASGYVPVKGSAIRIRKQKRI